MSTNVSPQGSLAAPMLVLLGPVVTLVASFVASAGEPLQLVHEAGALAFVATGASFVVTLALAAVLFVASRGASRWAALAAPLTLLPWAVMVLAALLGTGLVAEAVYHADPASQVTLTGMGSAEVMASRALGAALTLGGVLALSAAMLSLSLARSTDGAGARVPGSGLAALVLLGVAGVALLVLADAAVLRQGLAAASLADDGTRATLLGDTLDQARTTSLALLAVVALTTFLGFGVVVLALQRGSAGGGGVVVAAWLVGALFGGADIAMVHYVAARLAIPAPWASEPDFVALALDERGGPAGSVACLATLDRVRCQGGDAPYGALDGVLPRPVEVAPLSVGGLERGVTLAGEPALSVAIDARLPAPALRQLLLAASRAGYRSLTVVGAFTLPAFREGDVPPMLRTQAVVIPRTSWLLALAVSDGGDGLAPVAIAVRDDDTAESVARRTGEVVDQSVLVVPAPLPTVAPPPAVDDVAGQLGAAAGTVAPPTHQPLDAPAISRVIRSNAAAVRACYEHGLRANPELAGRVMVHFTIAPSGAVSDVTASPTLDAPPVLRCMEAAVASMTFPADAAREPISINYPFVFTASP